MSITMYTLAAWFLLFMAYSFFGWAVEVTITMLEHRKIVNRGFLVGPICPIYGTGALLISLILAPAENWVAIFCVAVVGASLLEYTVSVLMEHLFRVRWWDYSNKPFNLNGRICLESSLLFGVAGILIVKIVTPGLLALFAAMPDWLVYGCAIALMIWLIADILLSLWLIIGVRVTVGTAQKDATEEITEHVREVLMGKGKLNRRLVKAFPTQAPSKKPVRPRNRRKSSKRPNQKTAQKTNQEQQPRSANKPSIQTNPDQK